MHSCLDCNPLEVKQAEGPRSRLTCSSNVQPPRDTRVAPSNVMMPKPSDLRTEGIRGGMRWGRVLMFHCIYLSIRLSKDPARKLCTAARVT